MDLKNWNLHKEVLRLAVPSILANITVPLVGIVDTAIAGHIADATAIGGIAIGTMLFDLLYWNFGFLRVGTAGMTAQAWGKKKENPLRPSTQGDGTSEILIQSVTIALVAALFIWLLQYPFILLALKTVPCSEAVAVFARQYFFIRIWAAPATLLLMALRGWFIGMQNTVAPMVTDLVVNGVNMLASWLLAVCTPLGAMGVAYGTLIAQYSGLAVAVGLVAGLKTKEGKTKEESQETKEEKIKDEKTKDEKTKEKSLITKHNRLSSFDFERSGLSTFYFERSSLSSQNFRRQWAFISNALQWRKMRRLFVLNGNLFLRSLGMMVVYVGFTSLAARYGDTELAVSAIMMKLFMLFSYFIDGFAYAGEALTGRFVGAGDKTQFRKAVQVLFVWTIGIGIVCTGVYAVAGTGMIRLMTNDSTIVSAAAPYLIWLVLMPLVSCLAFMWDGVFIGATAGASLRNCMLLSAVGFVLAYLLLMNRLGIQALYAAYFVHLLLRTLYLSAAYKSVERRFFC